MALEWHSTDVGALENWMTCMPLIEHDGGYHQLSHSLDSLVTTDELHPIDLSDPRESILLPGPNPRMLLSPYHFPSTVTTTMLDFPGMIDKVAKS